MKAKILISLLSLLALSCKSTGNKIHDLDLRNTTELKAKVNQTVRIKLTTNTTTGYDWMTNREDDHDVLKIQSSFSQISNEVNKVGSPSYKVYEITPLKAGEHTIVFDYKRSWETNEKPINTKTVVIHVTK